MAGSISWVNTVACRPYSVSLATAKASSAVLIGIIPKTGYFEFTAQGIEVKENYMPKKYAVMILPIAGFLTTFDAAICFFKKV